MQWPNHKSKERQCNGQTVNQRRDNEMAKRKSKERQCNGQTVNQWRDNAMAKP